MEVREAARLAKKYVSDLFADEHITEIALEEVDFAHDSNTWRITIGFLHPAHAKTLLADQVTTPWLRPLERSYKVVHINEDDGHVVSLKDRFLAPAE